MKAFQFTLQALLDNREAIEKAIEAKLAAAIRELEQTREKQRMMMARIRKDIEHMESLRGSRVSHNAVSSLLRYVERFQCAIVAQSQKVAGAEVKMEECRNDLHSAMRKRKALERLLEGERVRWREELRRHEQKEMDEHARSMRIRGTGDAETT